MRIGIDIDDTITYTHEIILPMARLYDEEKYNGVNKDNDLIGSFTWSREEKDQFFNNFSSNYSQYLLIKNNANTYINKLYDEGYEIYFITYRKFENAYDVTKKYLDDNNIKYHKLIVNSGDKGKICSDEHINIFIDDSISHLDSALKHNKNINLLLVDMPYNRNNNIYKRVSNWNEIYNIIHNM